MVVSRSNFHLSFIFLHCCAELPLLVCPCHEQLQHAGHVVWSTSSYVCHYCVAVFVNVDFQCCQISSLLGITNNNDNGNNNCMSMELNSRPGAAGLTDTLRLNYCKVGNTHTRNKFVLFLTANRTFIWGGGGGWEKDLPPSLQCCWVMCVRTGNAVWPSELLNFLSVCIHDKPTLITQGL